MRWIFGSFGAVISPFADCSIDRALGWCRTWLSTTNLASISSCTGSTISLTTHKISKRDKIGSVRSTFSMNVREGSYLPPIGFEAAIMEQRACNEVTIPALEIEILCCSIASWIDVRSWSFILSNSSMRQTPVRHGYINIIVTYVIIGPVHRLFIFGCQGLQKSTHKYPNSL